MKYFYSFIILIIFFGCANNKTSWTAKAEIPEEIKDKNFYYTLKQVIKISKLNHLDVENIGVIFTMDNLYIYVSEAKKINLNSDYKYLQIKINGSNYKLFVNDNQDDKIVDSFLDLNKAISVSFEDTDIYEDDVRGYKIRFKKDLESNQFILQRLSHYFEYDKDFILKDDEKYFPNVIKIILPEPEPNPPVEEIK